MIRLENKWSLIILVTIIISISFVHAQPTWQSIGPGQNLRFNDVFFISENEGWAAGEDGVIAHTTDGGDNWTINYVDDISTFNSISFLQPNNGWAACAGGANDTSMFNSIDQGITWQPYSITSIPYCLRKDAVFFHDIDHGWMCGLGPYVYYTQNGGQTWEMGNNPPIHESTSYSDIYFKDPLNGIIVGAYGDILVTTDGGYTWQPQNSGTDWYLRAISAVSDSLLYVLGGGDSLVVLKTMDWGNTWMQVYSDSNLFSMFATDIGFCSADTGWITGWDQVFYTTNGGVDWVEQYMLPIPFSYESIFFLDNRNGWICGVGGGVYKYIPVPLSINEQQKFTQQFSIKSVFPNPFTNDFSVLINSAESKEYRIRVYNISGLSVYEKKYYLSSTDFKINIDNCHIPSGVYILEIRSLKTSESSVVKIIKK